MSSMMVPTFLPMGCPMTVMAIILKLKMSSTWLVFFFLLSAAYDLCFGISVIHASLKILQTLYAYMYSLWFMYMCIYVRWYPHYLAPSARFKALLKFGVYYPWYGMDLICSLLQFQIEKIVLFLLEQQGLLASRIAKLGEQHDALQQQPDISQISELREAYRAVGRDLLKLLFLLR